MLFERPIYSEEASRQLVSTFQSICDLPCLKCGERPSPPFASQVLLMLPIDLSQDDTEEIAASLV